MSAIEASLRLEIAQYQAALSRARGDFQAFKERIKQEGAGLGGAAFGGMQKAASGKSGGGGMNRLGGIALQAQDIAVQLQAGTKVMTVMAQQGSQLLSIFGPGGALLGGAIAIGGAFYMMGQKATEAFKQAQSDAAAFDGQMKTALAGTSGQIADFWGKVSQNIRASYTELESLNNGWSAIGAQMADIFGGPSVEARAQLANEQRIKQENALLQIQQRLLEVSAMETEIARLRNAGETEKADAMQRQLELAQQLARIQGMQLPDDVKAQLSSDAAARSAYSGGAKGDPKKTAEEIQLLEQKAREDKLAALDPQERMVELSKQEEAIYASMATKGGLFFDQSMQGLEAWAEAKKKAGDMTGYLDVLRMLEQARALQEQIGSAQKEITDARDKRDSEADKKREEIEATKQQMAEEQERFAERFKAEQAAKQSLKEEIMLLQAKAAGNDDLVAQMERELRIREKAKQIQAQTNVSDQQARNAASQMVALEDAAAKGRTPAAAGGMRRRMMGGASGPLADISLSLTERARRNADAADGRGSRDTSALDLGSKIFEILQRNLE